MPTRVVAEELATVTVSQGSPNSHLGARPLQSAPTLSTVGSGQWIEVRSQGSEDRRLMASRAGKFKWHSLARWRVGPLARVVPLPSEFATTACLPITCGKWRHSQ